MFFYVAKIAWFLLQPSALVLLLLMAAWWCRRKGWDAPAARFVAASLLLCCAAMSPLPNLLTLPLEQRFDRVELAGAPITGVLILGGGEDAIVASARKAHGLNEAGERITEAVALARLLPGARIVFTGGSASLLSGRPTEADAVKRMLIAMGVDPGRITVEDRSRDTWENAVFTKAIVQPKSAERWLLVTSAWHMPRSMGVFRAAGFGVEPWPVDYRTTGWGDAMLFQQSPADGLKRLDFVMREYIGLVAYWLKGRSSSLFPAPDLSPGSSPAPEHKIQSNRS